MDHTDLERAVSRQSWDWLIDLAARLDIVVEMVDESGVPMFPVGPGPDADTFRTFLTTGEPTVHSAIADVADSTKRVLLCVDSIHALCCGLSPGGVLLIARKLAVGDSIDECRQELDAIGNWLSGAVEASLSQSNAISVEPYRITSFRRILREATSRGSIRKVIGAFVEALSVWDDVRVRCYVAGASGGLFQYGSSLTALPASVDELDESIVPPHGRMVRVPRAEVSRLGLVSEPGDTVLLRVLVGDILWLLVFSGMLDDREQVRLKVYSDILRESLNDVVSATSSRLGAELARAHRSSSESPEATAQAAFYQLMTAVGGQQGALALTMPSGQQMIVVGDTDLLALENEPDHRRLVVRSTDSGTVMTLVAERDQGPFTAFERDIVLAGMTVVHHAIQGGLQRPADVERRRRFRPVDSVFDQLAADTLATGRQASVIVLSMNAPSGRPGLLPAWVGKIRAQLRAGDFAGILSEREIAVLLCGASAEHANSVSARLKRVFRSDEDADVFLQATIGMTTRSPESSAGGSIVGAARALASSRH
jgi:hypothetical protein